MSNNKFSSIQIKLASPERIREWSFGEVTKAETINYRSQKPERDGLFCERIFGPSKDWECHCGKYKKVRYKGVVCDRCGVEVTKASVRRERMGHIELAAPVAHIWYLKGIPSRMALLLDVTPKQLEEVVYFVSWIVTDPKDTDLNYKEVLDVRRLKELQIMYGKDGFVAQTGAEAVKTLLEAIDLKAEHDKIKEELQTAQGEKHKKLIKRFTTVDSFLKSNQKPQWMILDVLPVIPPDLRPMLQLDGGRYATSDLNDLYRRVITRNRRLKKYLEDKNTPILIVRNEKRMLQEAVDALIDNGRRSKPVTGAGSRALKSLSHSLKGKQGRFRQNLLGKRVDFSGRSVIAVGPDLKMYECGLPREMAIQLFKPFVINELVTQGIVTTHRAAEKKIEELDPSVWGIVEGVIKNYPVLLNRAPTLHRLGIQAFKPKLVEGRAIRLHPLVTPAFNADFDGDQMAVHVPLSEEARAEALTLMLGSNNILGPKDGKPIVTPSQDMVLGNFYLTMEETIVDMYENADRFHNVLADKLSDQMEEFAKEEWHIYHSENEILMAYEMKEIHLHSRIAILAKNLNKTWDPEFENKYLLTTVGKVIFNDMFPSDFPFINEISDANFAHTPSKYFVTIDELYKKIEFNRKLSSVRDELKSLMNEHAKIELENANPFELEDARRQIESDLLINNSEIKKLNEEYKLLVAEFKASEHVPDAFKKKDLGVIISHVFARYGTEKTSLILDEIKNMGFKYSTVAGMTVSIADIEVVEGKTEDVNIGKKEAEKLMHLRRKGLLTPQEWERYFSKVWDNTKDKIGQKIMRNLYRKNPINMMATSGARGSASNFTQLCGMRGLMAKPAQSKSVKTYQPSIIEVPIYSCFREGLNVSEFFISTHGVRKGLTDTALKTAESGYLTRRLVIVAQDVVVKEEDCGTQSGFVVSDILDDKQEKVIESLKSRIIGRFVAKDVIHPATNEVLVEANQLVDEETAIRIVEAGIKEVEIRSAFTCKSKHGVCKKCYGRNMATGKVVEVGEAIGVMAAQSIGEPGTQLTMRTFHTGGVASGDGGDITQGLPRVEELFEARAPKGAAVLSKISGIITNIRPGENNIGYEVTVANKNESVDHKIGVTQTIRSALKVNSQIEAGEKITEGQINPKELLEIAGIVKVQEYILKEVLKVYQAQGIELADKHIEVMVRQMLRKVVVTEGNDTDLHQGMQISLPEITKINQQALMNGLVPAKFAPVLLGVSKSSVETDSFLAAASFQETTKVLTDASIKGKIDSLIGLNENVIVGNLIPAGTGFDTDEERESINRINETAEHLRIIRESKQIVQVESKLAEFIDKDAKAYISEEDVDAGFEILGLE